MKHLKQLLRGFTEGERPDWDTYALIVAAAVSVRGECVRRRVGAVILDAAHRIAGAGYNGSYPGGPSCLKGECPRGKSDVAPGSSYDTGPGMCHAVHAEMNAILDVSERARLKGGTLYVTDEPCQGCLKLIRNTPLSEVVWPEGRISLGS